MGVTRMTDKEAKTILVNLTYLFGDEEVLEALDVAISALSEPLLTHEEAWVEIESDLISRADAMGAIQDHFNADGFKGYDDGQNMMNRIKALPSADRPITSGYIADDTKVPPYTTTSAVSAEPTTRERKEAKSTLLTLKHLFEDEQILKALDVAIECVSAERVVHCRDCDNTVPHWYMLNGKRVDCNWCVEMESEVDDDEYCSRAVPKGTRAKMKGGTE